MEIIKIWQKITDWLSENAPNVLSSLSNGATEEQIIRAEKALNIIFPEDFKTSYKIYNGQKNNSNIGFINGWDLLSLDGIIYEWEECLDSYNLEKPTQPEKGIKNGWFNQKWLPFTYDGDSNSYCLDLDPDIDGTVGQIIMVWHDDPLRSLVSNNFTEFLNDFYKSLISGEYKVNEKYGLIYVK